VNYNLIYFLVKTQSDCMLPSDTIAGSDEGFILKGPEQHDVIGRNAVRHP
jgi:hypothetical protein